MSRIYIYGAGVIGLALINKIYVRGGKADGIIDVRGKDLFNGCDDYLGIPVYRDVNEIDFGENDEMLITSTDIRSIADIRDNILGAGLNRSNIRYVQDYSVYVDVSGKCNLKCKSCQVSNGNTPYVKYDERGYMDPALYEEIIQKIKRENPLCQYIFLYIHGEPLLNPFIADIVDITHKYNLAAIISTNLSMKINFEKLMKSHPDCIKVSVSGFSQNIYASTHCGGNIALVKDNIDQLCALRNKFKSYTPIMVGYHSYSNNQGQEKINMQCFCKERNVLFQEVTALYSNRIKQWGQLPYTNDDISFVNSVYKEPGSKLHPDLVDESIRKLRCEFIENSLWINYKGDVILCCNVLDDRAVYGNYLDCNVNNINKQREKSEFCIMCKKYGMHTYVV